MDITDTQLEAFNNKDLEKFMLCYSDSVKVFMLQSGQVLTDGKDQLTEIMKKSFEEDKTSTTTVLSKIANGNLIINQEQITGHTDGKIIKTMSIYEVENNLITKLWFGGRSTEETK